MKIIMVSDGQDVPIEFDSDQWLKSVSWLCESDPSYWWGRHVGDLAKSLLDAENVHRGMR